MFATWEALATGRTIDRKNVLAMLEQPLRAGMISSPGPAVKNILCCSFLSEVIVRYQDRQTRCDRSRSRAGSRDKMEGRNSGILKVCWTAEDNLFSCYFVL